MHYLNSTYALRPRINAELQSLETSGILLKIDWSDCPSD